MCTQPEPQNQESRLTQGAVKSDHWIDRLCDALAEGFEDTTLSGDAYNGLADAMTGIIEDYNGPKNHNANEARTVLRDALRIAVNQPGDKACAKGCEPVTKGPAVAEIDALQTQLIDLLGNDSLLAKAHNALNEILEENRAARKSAAAISLENRKAIVNRFVTSLGELVNHVPLPQEIYSKLAHWWTDTIEAVGVTDNDQIQLHLGNALLRLAEREEVKHEEK